MAATNRPTAEEMFGESLDDDGPAAAAEAEKKEQPYEKMYVAASAVADAARPQQMYVTPEQLKGGGIYVEKLSQLDAGMGAVNLGRLDAMHDAGPDGAGARIAGARDFGSFLCGRYRRLIGITYNDRPVYRSSEPAAENCPAFCMGHHLFLFYHKRNSAWVIGMKVNSGSGACAFVLSDAMLPMDGAAGDNTWHVSMENGGFQKQPTMTCVLDNCSDVAPPADFRLPKSNDDVPAGRHEAEEMLHSHVAKLPGAAGYHVLRESSSVPNAFVVSILLADGNVEHLIVTKMADGAYTVTPEYTDGRALSFLRFADVVDHGYTSGFVVRSKMLKLGRCIYGEDLAK
mmetsp:Transcript_9646/g.29200  ORF Transcript_9646/g.29200 Transcript_9646/m.29200 type:complete len:343 (+) Transcript_9646:218-1246(+)